MKLKTLKDIEGVDCDCCVSRRWLRQEAIKWIKEDIESYKNQFGDILKGKEIKSLSMEIIKKWMKRFNITSGELK